MAVTVLQGHALDALATLPARQFHVAVTSPPYYQLRRYGTPPQVWVNPDGTPLCAGEHEWADAGKSATRLRNGRGSDLPGMQTKKTLEVHVLNPAMGAFCAACGAWRGELGWEPDLGLYLAHLLSVFAGVHRVLRDDGTLWVNLGDCYWNNPGGQNGGTKNTLDYGAGRISAKAMEANRQVGRVQRTHKHPTLKPKNLSLVPWRFCIAMQDAGWYVRSIVAWAKSSAMPEPVQDRPTSAWEPIFLFAKRARYYYDAEAVRVRWSDERNGASGARSLPYSIGSGRNDTLSDGVRPGLGVPPQTSGANLRNFWLLGPEPLTDEHYAAYPSEIVRRAVRASTSERGCCPTCGAPWRRMVERDAGRWTPAAGDARVQATGGAITGGTARCTLGATDEVARRTTGWEPTCAHNAEPIPARVLDPFGGSGTTGLVADQLGRDATLIELNGEYAQMAQRRVTRDAPLFADVRVETVAQPLALPLDVLEAAG